MEEGSQMHFLFSPSLSDALILPVISIRYVGLFDDLTFSWKANKFQMCHPFQDWIQSSGIIDYLPLIGNILVLVIFLNYMSTILNFIQVSRTHLLLHVSCEIFDITLSTL